MKTTTPKSLFGLKGRVAVVTGGLGKLGLLWNEALLEAGASVAALDRPGVAPSAEFRRLQKRYPGRLVPVGADITRRADLLKARQTVQRRLGRTAILVNNAGIDQPPQKQKASRLFRDIPVDDVRGTFEVNFLGALQVLQAFGDDLAESGHGAVINIGSLYSVVSPDQRLYEHIPSRPPFLKPPAYGASKAALMNLTKFLATLWAPRRVRVNALSPGGVYAGQDPEFVRKYSARTPMGRMATLEDLRGPLLFLASDASSYVTGINLMVDGGFTAW
jgi:NAD(P)-dependent dehydrogenase (short-subunit alcohol dehydrogenase family)